MLTAISADKKFAGFMLLELPRGLGQLFTAGASMILIGEGSDAYHTNIGVTRIEIPPCRLRG